MADNLAIGRKPALATLGSPSSSSRRRPGSLAAIGTGLRRCDEYLEVIFSNQD
jgi:hypothetical protein